MDPEYLLELDAGIECLVHRVCEETAADIGAKMLNNRSNKVIDMAELGARMAMRKATKDVDKNWPPPPLKCRQTPATLPA